MTSKGMYRTLIAAGAWSSRSRRCSGRLRGLYSNPQIGPRKFNELVTPAIDDGLQHVKAEPFSLLKLNLFRHDKFLLRRHHIQDHWSLMKERHFDSVFELVWILDTDAVDANRFRHGSEIGIFEIGPGVEVAGRFHFHGDKAERRIVVDNNLHRQF